MKLDGHKKEVHDGQEIVAKKKLESKFLGTGRKPFKNARLWALDVEKKEIYEVNVQSKTAHKISGLGSSATIERATHKAHVNKDHPLVWAVNYKNAIKKFMKLKFKTRR